MLITGGSAIPICSNLKTKIEIGIHTSGKALTGDLRISMSVLTYKYNTLTDCATGADVL